MLAGNVSGLPKAVELSDTYGPRRHNKYNFYLAARPNTQRLLASLMLAAGRWSKELLIFILLLEPMRKFGLSGVE
jgi:hypothetical protein